MRPLTDHCPKPLLEVNSKPLIVHHLEALRKAGIEHVVINVSWLADQIRQAVGDGSQFGLRIDFSNEIEALETAGGIVQALPVLDDEFIVVNADIYTDFDFARLLSFQSEAHLVLVQNPEHNPAGDFAINQGFLSNSTQARLTFSGIAAYRKSFFAGLRPGKRALAPLLRQGAEQQRICAVMYSGIWSDVGTPERLQALNSTVEVS